MATEDIIVSVGGDVSALKRGMGQGARDVKKFGNITRADLKRTAARFAKFGAAAAAAAVAAGGLFAREALKSADAIRKLSIRTGVATDALQELQHAYNLAGVDQQAFNNGLETFGKRLGKARDGFGALKEGLRGSNEQFLQNILAADNTTDALNRVFKAMGKATSEAQRLAIADAAFGGVGLKMTSAFEDGAGAFNKARQEAHDLGLVLSEDLLKNAEKLNDDFAKASGIIKTQLSAAFLELAPAISKSVTALISFLTELREVEAITKRLQQGDKFSVAFGNVSDRIQEIQKRLGQFRKQAGADLIFGDAIGPEQQAIMSELMNELTSLKIIRDAMLETQKEENQLAKENTKETEKQAEAEKKIVKARQAAMNMDTRRPGSPNRGEGGTFRAGAFNIQTARIMGEGENPVARSIAQLARFTTRQAGNVGDTGGGGGINAPMPRNAAFNPNARRNIFSFGQDRGSFGMDQAAGMGVGDGALEQDIAAQQIEAMKNRFKTLEELEVERFEKDQALLEQRMSTEAEKQMEHLSLMENLQKEHAGNMLQIRKDKANREQMIEDRNRQMLVSGAQQLVQEVGRTNEGMFKAAQVASAGIAMVNAVVSASNILRNSSTMDFSFGVAATAAAMQVLATGLGFVNAIKSTTKSGGGGGQVVGAGGVPSTPTVDQGEPTRNVFINVRGGGRDVRAIIEQINEEIKDGSKLAGISVG